MAAAADDKVVMKFDADGGAGFFDLLVISKSAREGVVLPEGWLCTIMIDEA